MKLVHAKRVRLVAEAGVVVAAAMVAAAVAAADMAVAVAMAADAAMVVASDAADNRKSCFTKSA